MSQTLSLNYCPGAFYPMTRGTDTIRVVWRKEADGHLEKNEARSVPVEDTMQTAICISHASAVAVPCLF